ncbi:hypothetical protein PIROE2DRAFT_3069 [Piromyces sp. E2]|nr:hypothetical protein PIROE2DRAFT_3069 [Piromyces sp. E2]|eukprot:OUM69016.1 hypothetical protein PIROE2DRAFT_3069 [Piromyces sp. E2]
MEIVFNGLVSVYNFYMNKTKNDHRKDKETSTELSDEKKEFHDFLEKANWYITSNDEVFEIFNSHL